MKKWALLLGMMCALGGQPLAAQSLQKMLYADMLDKAGSAALGQVTNRAGQFLAGKGWQATASNSQLMITLPQNLPAEGTLAVNVQNFDPVSQNINIKQQIINLYSQANGSKDIFYTEGSWINIRTGTGYSTGPGVAGFKMLAAPCGVGTRREVRIMENATWNLSKIYEFKITWDASSASCYLDGQKMWTLPFSGQKEPFRYIFLGTDNVYMAQPGVIYSNLRILGSGDTADVSADETVQLPKTAVLLPNYPNPFNPGTTLAFELATSEMVTLQVVNLFGQTMATLVHEKRPAGRHSVTWDGCDAKGRSCAAGVYYSRLVTPTAQIMQRMTLIK